jgi:hypothetical protein
MPTKSTILLSRAVKCFWNYDQKHSIWFNRAEEILLLRQKALHLFSRSEKT